MEKELGRWSTLRDVHVTVDGESVLLLSPRGEYFGLDDVGAQVWRAIERDDLADTIQKLSKAFRIPAEVVAQDVTSLLGDLQKAGLIRRTST